MKSMIKMKLKLLILLTIIFISIGDIGYNNSTTYRSLVDDRGFYRVIDTNTGISLPYDNHTFNISIGDNVIWTNEDQSDILAIISEQELWKDDKAILRHTGSQFNYTFGQLGTYVFSIKRYKMLPKQTIIVSDNNVNVSIPNVTEPTPNATITPSITDIEPTPNVTEPTPNATITPSITDIKPIPNVTIIPSITGTEPIPNTTDVNITRTTNISTKDRVLINPILVPLNILRNTKLIVLAIFIVVVIFILVK